MFIGIDLGTTACKAARFSARGEVLAQYHREYGLITRESFVEQDAQLWWQMVLEALRALADSQVQGISISTQGLALVAADAEGIPLGNAISWLDDRGEKAARQLEEKLGRDYIYQVTGKHCGGAYVLPKLMWMQQHQAEIYEKARWFLMPLDYLNLRLTGRALTDYTVAGGSMAYDMKNKRYDPALLQEAGVDREKLAPVACMGTPVGKLLPQVLKETGLPADCMVYLGGQDQKLAALGAGIDDATLTLSLGTASALTRLVKTTGQQSGISAFRFDEDSCSLEGVLNTSGGALKWLMELLGKTDYEQMNRLAQEAGDAGGVVFQTDLAVGGSISNLKLGTTAGNLVYALMEGVGRAVGEMAEKMGGCERIVAFGGGARSDIWCRILANTTAKTLCIPETEETGILGAARLASQLLIPPAKIKKTYTAEI